MLNIGIIGLPNVGKSTLFNALLKKQSAFVANYPFATIEPNIGIVPVPDNRLNILQEVINKSTGVNPPIFPAIVKFVDIAGLVKGAAKGEGLGNKFLSHIREVDVIFQVVRHFKTSNVHHITGAPNPENDLQIINMELIFADLQTLEKQIGPKKIATKEELIRWEGIKKLKDGLNKEILVKDIELTKEERKQTKELQLLTAKPMMIVANVDEEDLKKYFDKDVIAISAKTESELAQLSEEEQKDYLSELGLDEPGLERIIKKGYALLNLISFLTAREKEVRAWTIEKGITAVDAAGTIHTDFSKKFIKAEVVSFRDFVENNGWKKSRDAGKSRFEGKTYIVKDGDVIEFKIGT
ncbi:MAG: redox-regulated ATPase YchF [Candidatus Levyibacteriota bacterium]